jgi:hypothetical protein
VYVTAQSVAAGAGVVGVVAVAAGLVSRAPAARSWVRGVAALACVVGGVAASTWVAITWAVRAAGDAQDATLGARVLLVVVGLAWGLLPLLLLPRGADGRDLAAPPATLELAADERAAWHATQRSAPLLAAAGAALVVVVVLGLLVTPLAWPFLAVPLLVLAVLGRVVVSVDHRGLRVRGGLGVPLRTVPLARVARADAAEVRAPDWGGWGYRVGPGRAAVVLRSGPGLVVELTDESRFAVTLDDAATPAALLNTLARRGAPSRP